jgi:hypothetical protein
LANGGTKVSFYFKSNVSGMDMVTATATGLTLATQTETIAAATLAEVRFSPATLTVLAGDCSAVSQLRLTDTYGNPGSPASSVSVALAGTGVTYFTDASCSSTLTTPVVLTNGTPTQNLYVKKTLVSSTTVTGTASGYTTGNLALTVNVNVAYKLAYITQPSATAWETVALTAQPKVGIYDQYDNLRSTDTSAITLSAASNGGCSSTAGGTLNATLNPLLASAGASQFAGVSYTGTGTVYLKASASGLTDACSNSVTVSADYSQSLSKAPGNIPSDGLAEATIFVSPKKGSTALGTGKTIEITSSSTNVTMTCNGSACSACQTPAATCVKAYDYGQGAYSVTVKSSTPETVNFTIRHNDAGVLNGITTLSPVFNTANFTSISATASVTSANATQNLYLTGGTVTFDNTTMGLTFGDVFVRGAAIVHTATAAGTVYKLDVSLSSLTMLSGSISANGKGYLSGYSYGPTAPATSLVPGQLYGGSHGGIEGQGSAATYDDYRNPQYPGAGAGYTAQATPGGGVVRLQVTGGCTINSGAAITANGNNFVSGGGGGAAGGSINLTCANFAGTAAASAITANGGNPQSASYGAGGGGRIALTSTNDMSSFAGSFAFPSDATKMTNIVSVIRARGGTTFLPGGAGTIYLKSSDLTYGGLIVYNGGTIGTQTALPYLDKTTGTVSGSNLPFTAALATGFNDLYKNMRVRPDTTATNGTPTNLLDDNIVTITANTLSQITTTGSLASVPSGTTLRTLEILDYLSIGGSATLSTGSDLVVLSGNFVAPTLDITDGSLTMLGNGTPYPAVNQLTLTTGTYSGTNLSVSSLVVSGATLNYSGTITGTNITVNSGTVTANTLNSTNLTLAGGTYTVTTSNVTNDFTISGGTNTSPANVVGRDLLVSGGTSTLDTTSVGRDFTMSSGTIYHRATISSAVYSLAWTINGNVTMTGGSLNANGRGYLSTYSYGATGPSTVLSPTPSYGGSHGGLEGLATAPTYDDYRNPQYPGAGPGYAAQAIPGGGVIRLQVTGSCTVNSGATIVANGNNYTGSGGGGAAGGSIYLNCASFAGTAAASAITANGGNPFNSSYGAGGGGRIALISTGAMSSFMGSFAFPSDATKMTNIVNVIRARGGATKPGGAGTIYLKSSDLTYGGLIVHNGAAVGTQTLLPYLDKTTGAVSGSNLPFTTSLASGYIDLYKNMRVRPDTTATNGTPANLLDDNIVTITANTLSQITTTGSLASVPAATTLRTIEILDYLNVAGSATLSTGSDLVVLSGNFITPDLDFTDGMIAMIGSGTSYPATNQLTLNAGTYTGTDLNFSTITVGGATLTYTGTLNGTSMTVNSGVVTVGTVNTTNLTLAGGTYTATTSNVTNDLTISGGTNISPTNVVGRDLLVSGGTSTLDTISVGRDFTMSSGTINHRAATTSAAYSLAMTIGGNATMTGGSLAATSRGYLQGYSYGPTGPTTALSGTSLYGGSHGGIEGRATAVTYDDYRDPRYPGAGAGYTSQVLPGGGVVRLQVTGGCTINSGATIIANGTTATTSGGGGGAGGSIYLNCASFAGTAAAAAITANGGNPFNSSYGAGGGGRIALISTGAMSSFTGSFAFPNDATKMTSFVNIVRARGGATYIAGAGTIFLKSSDLTYGGLIVHNGAQAGVTTPMLNASANSYVINAKTSSNVLQITSASTPYTNYVNYYAGYPLHIWPTSTGNVDPLSTTHVVANITTNAANSFTVAGSPYASTTIAADYSYRITHTLDALYIGGNGKVDFAGSDLILNGAAGLSCDFTSAVAQNFVVPAGSTITNGNSYSSINCPDGNFSTKATTINFTRYCNGLGTCL